MGWVLDKQHLYLHQRLSVRFGSFLLLQFPHSSRLIVELLV